MRPSVLLALVSLVTTACTQGAPNFTSSSSSAASGAAGDAKLLVANRAMANDKAEYASPANGGLIGKLFIQPRALMSAPDSQVTGCSQAGEGALGLDAYLSHPEWASEQRVLFSDLFVPTRNFSLGFPSPNGDGTTLPVRSFFVLDGKGYFRLAAGEPEGDYQFAVIADDGARLLIGDGNGGAPTMIVDDQKPAGPNGGCLEQTMSAHMSCTTVWNDQSAGKVRTVHVKPGQLIPIELQYWQGPGFGLSMMAFYRKVDAANPLDAACGQEWGFGDASGPLSDVLKTWTPLALGNLSN